MLKKLVLTAAVVSMAAPAMASKARLSALSSAAHLSDTTDTYTKPHTLLSHGQWASFEFGTGGANNYSANPKAEGGFTRSMGEAVLGFNLGGTPSYISDARNAWGNTIGGSFTAAQQNVDNPFTVSYGTKAGDMTWGLGLVYANQNNKTSAIKSSVTGIHASVAQGAWDANLQLGLTNTHTATITNTDHKFTGKSSVNLAAGYLMEDWYFQARLVNSGGKWESGSTAVKDYDYSLMAVDAVNSSKIDGGEFFWGASYEMKTTKQGTGTSGKKEETYLPFVVGIEADAASWMVLRGSLTQNFLLGSVKNDIAGTGAETDTVANNTTVAAGAGIKWNKFTLDGTLAGATTGTINGNSLLANASLTYKW